MNPATNSLHLAGLGQALALHYFPQGRVDPEFIARREGIPVFHTDLADAIDGLLIRQLGSQAIIVNERLAPRGSERSRFTIAHELGHAFAGPDGFAPELFVARTPGSGRPEERHADRFAANLLLPEPSFRDYYASLSGTGLAKISDLATLFGTSLLATAYRAAELDCEPAPHAVIGWNRLGERCGKCVSPSTLLLGDEFFTLPLTAPHSSVTAKAMRNGRDRLLVGRTALTQWFPDIWLEQKVVEDLHEEVIRRGGFGWLTWLQG